MQTPHGKAAGWSEIQNLLALRRHHAAPNITSLWCRNRFYTNLLCQVVKDVKSGRISHLKLATAFVKRLSSDQRNESKRRIFI